MSAVKTRKHKHAGKSMPGSEIVLQVIADEGVDTIFGYSGGAILPTYDAIFRHNKSCKKSDQINLVVPANEQGAGFMAAGYARATGKVGTVVVTSGPGATNCTTPIRDCMSDSVPVVLFCGQVPCAAIGTDAFQEAPVFSIMSSCAKHVFLVSKIEELEETVRSAYEIARSGRPGPVVIDLPKDVQNSVIKFKGKGILKFKGYEKRTKNLKKAKLTKNETSSFFSILKKSRRPLIYAGGGIISSEASGELQTFSKRFGIPVVNTLMGIGAVDATSDLALNMLGMHGTAYANYAVEDCDFLIAIGARFDDRVAGNVESFARGAKIAHIDIDAAEIGKVKSVDWAHVGDAKTALKDLISAGKSFDKDFTPWLKKIKKLKKEHRLDYDRESKEIQPQMVLELLNKIVKGNAIICTGVGQHQMWAAQYSLVHKPRHFITSGSMGTMGFGLPAAIGAQIGCPDMIVIDVDGDGSIRMNIGELETAVSYDVPVKVLLLNNYADGMVRQWQHLFFDSRFSGTDKTLRTKDFIKSVEADGFKFARRVTEKSELKKSLQAFVKFKGAAFLEVVIDRDACVYPMVGPGKGYEDMITGPFINPRGESMEERLDTSDGF